MVQQSHRGTALAVGVLGLAGLFAWSRTAKASEGNERDPVPEPPDDPPPVPAPDLPDDAPNDPIAPDSVGACVAGMVCGKGLFVRSLRHGQDPFDAEGRHFAGLDALVYRLQWMGIDWVAVSAIFQESDRDRILGNDEDWNTYVEHLRAAGIQVWAWGWPDPRPNRLPEFTRIARAVAPTVAGFIVDPEAPWNGRASVASGLMAELGDMYPGRLGCVLYGSRSPQQDHPRFPWAEFAGSQDSFFNMPMLYETQRPDSFSRDLVARWARDFGKPVIPIFSATNQRTPAGMEAIVRRTPVPAGACGWWDLYWATNAGNPARTDIVRRTDLTIRPTRVA